MINVFVSLLRQLLYIPLAHTWVRMPSFLFQADELLLSFLLFWLMGAAAVLIAKDKESFKLSFLTAPYLGIVTHLLLSIFLTIFIPIAHASVYSIYVIIIATLIIWWLRRKTIQKFVESTIPSGLFFSFLGSLLIVFFIHNFTYQNGLHDEWYHYPAIKHTIETNSYFFFHPQTGRVSSSYHTGSYWSVVAIQQLVQPDLEQALDIAKMVFWVPFVPLSSYLLARSWQKKEWMVSIIVFCSLFVGPNLFLLDRFTQNVFTGSSYPQPANPLFFEVSTVTWLGGALTSIILQIALKWLKSKAKGELLLCLMLLTGLVFIHRLFFAVALVLMMVLLVLDKDIQLILIKRKSLLVLFFFFLIMAGVVLKDQYSGLLFHLLFCAGEFHLPLRAMSDWGFPYQYSGGVLFAQPVNLAELRLVGINWFSATLLLLWSYRRRLLSTHWMVIFNGSIIILPLLASILRFGSDVETLAFDKLIRFSSFYIGLLYGFFILHPKVPRAVKTLLVVLFICSVFSSLYYFATANVVGVNREWVSSK